MYLPFSFNIIDDDGEYYAILFSTKAQHASKIYFKVGKNGLRLFFCMYNTTRRMY